MLVRRDVLRRAVVARRAVRRRAVDRRAVFAVLRRAVRRRDVRRAVDAAARLRLRAIRYHPPWIDNLLVQSIIRAI